MQSLSGSITEAVVGLPKDRSEIRDSRILADFPDRGLVKLCRIHTREPVSTVAEEVIAELSVALHIEGLVQGPEATNLLNIDRARNLTEGGQVGIPAMGYREAVRLEKLFLKPRRNPVDEIRRGWIGKHAPGLEMFVEVGGFRGSDADRVDEGICQAVEIIEEIGEYGAQSPESFSEG